MTKHLLRVLIPLGLAAIAVGVVSLERVFVRERSDALDSLAAERAALESYAVLDLLERSREALEATRERRERAEDDPLVDGSDLVLVRGGEQVLPRRWEFLPANDAPTRALYTSLVSGDGSLQASDDGEPWAERLRYFARFRRALDANDRAGIEHTFRAILTHRSRFVVHSRDDIAYSVALVTLLERKTSADPTLMERMLRDGLTDSRGNHVPGLQRHVLDRREKLTRGDFDFLVERIASLSETSGVRHDDFTLRVIEASAPRVPLPDAVEEAILVGSWFVEPSAGGAVFGVSVDVDALTRATLDEMRERGLVDDSDVLELQRADGAETFESLRTRIVSERLDSQRADIDTRFWIKTALVGVLFILTTAALVVAAAWTRRERQLLALKSDFVAAVSHELRTPLASMRLMAETLSRRLEGSEAARDYPDRLVREIDSLDFLVENILSFQRLDKGRWTPRLEDVRLADMVETLERELSGATRAKLQIELSGARDVVLRADPELMKLLFLNLGTNACKYNDGDSILIRIEAEDRGPVVVRVADNGIGIPGDKVEEVFTEFYRAESGGRGFGLGLAICRRIMELHSGQIRVASSSPSGTTFEMSFP